MCHDMWQTIYKGMGSDQMKILVTGGNRGLGLDIVNEFSADGISRQSGFDITKDITDIATRSTV